MVSIEGRLRRFVKRVDRLKRFIRRVARMLMVMVIGAEELEEEERSEVAEALRHYLESETEYFVSLDALKGEDFGEGRRLTDENGRYEDFFTRGLIKC
ncbi:MAG: hypothetical protein ACTSXX_05830 [Candidatus Baldrarchaeia archaeon]